MSLQRSLQNGRQGDSAFHSTARLQVGQAMGGMLSKGYSQQATGYGRKGYSQQATGYRSEHARDAS